MVSETTSRSVTDGLANQATATPPRSDAAQISPVRPQVAKYFEVDIESGWPPKLRGTVPGRPTPTASSVRYIDSADLRRSVDVAESHPEVERYLIGRWEVLGSQPLARRRTSRFSPQPVQVTIFNYTNSCLVKICVEDGHVTSIEEKDSHESPEAPVEVIQAVAIARADPALGEKVAGLAAHGILQVPPDGPSQGHRCILVMFTELDDPQRELPVLYRSLVDLNRQVVVLSGSVPPCGCSS